MPNLTQKKPGGSLVKQWNVQDKPLTVGRGDDVDVKVDDGELSRRHFRITPTATGHTIEDLGSRNGTLVNGRKITGVVVLKRDDKICAGQSLFVFEEGLRTVIRKLQDEPKGYSTFIREISKPPKRAK